MKNKVASSDVTQVTFRIKTSPATFYRRVTNNFYESGIIHAPTLKNLFKTCLNIMARRHVKLRPEVTCTGKISRLSGTAAAYLGPKHKQSVQLQKEGY